MKKKICILALSTVLLGGICVNTAPALTASAGWMETDPVESSALSGKELDKTAWLIEDGISLKDEKVVFAKDTFEEAKLMNRTKLNTSVEKSNFVIEATIEVKEIVGEKRFGLGFGFERIRNIVGDENTSYFYVEKSGNGYVAGLCSYDKDGEKTELIETPVALDGSKWEIELIGSYFKNVTAKIDGRTVYEGEVTAESINGYFGFLETGDTTATQYSEEYVSAISVSNDYYDTPENVNIYDDFNDGSLDTSVWHLYNNAGYLKGVAETDGMLRFIDSNESTVTTKYQYSNFELSLDIPYVKKKADFNSDGSLKTAACNWFGFFCGIQTDDYAGITTATKLITDFSAYFLSFRTQQDNYGDALGGTTVYFGPTTGRTGYGLPEKYDLWDVANEDKILNVVFTCLEGVYTLDVKWAEETEYYHVFTAQYPLTTGYITLLGYGLGDAWYPIKSNFAYDNVKITNRDYKGNVISGLFPESEALIEETEDYGYADTKSPAQLLEDGTDFDDRSSDGCGGVLDMGMATIATLASGMAALTKRRNRK